MKRIITCSDETWNKPNLKLQRPAKATGLTFEKKYIETAIKPNVAGQLYNSKKFPFRLLPDCLRPIGNNTLANKSVGAAAFDRMKTVPDYRPKNLEKQLQKRPET